MRWAQDDPTTDEGSGMTSPIGPQIDFFVSRRGSAAAVAQEVANILEEEGYTVFVQDHDIGYGADFIAAMHDGLKRCRHMIVLLTEDYVASEFTMMEVTNFLAAAGQAADERRLAILRLDEAQPDGILASRVYGDLVGITEPQERRRRILAAVEGRSTATQRRPKIFENVPPRDLNFMGRDQALLELHRLLTGSNGGAAVNCAAIHGLGGTGKSSLAAEYAHRRRAFRCLVGGRRAAHVADLEPCDARRQARSAIGERARPVQGRESRFDEVGGVRHSISARL